MESRRTWQKQAVYDALCSLDHPSATEVYERTKTTYPSLSRGTVFRVLGEFAQNGKIKKIQLSDSDIRYDFRTERHYHARCRCCGTIRDVFLPLPRELETVRLEAFTVDGCEVEFFGLCAECAKNA